MERKTPAARGNGGSGFHLADDTEASTENRAKRQPDGAPQFIVGERIDGQFYACVAASKYTQSAISASRLGAALAPFPDDAAARAALESASCFNIREMGR